LVFILDEKQVGNELVIQVFILKLVEGFAIFDLVFLKVKNDGFQGFARRSLRKPGLISPIDQVVGLGFRIVIDRGFDCRDDAFLDFSSSDILLFPPLASQVFPSFLVNLVLVVFMVDQIFPPPSPFQATG
jgi:hypothetical protein